MSCVRLRVRVWVYAFPPIVHAYYRALARHRRLYRPSGIHQQVLSLSPLPRGNHRSGTYDEREDMLRLRLITCDMSESPKKDRVRLPSSVKTSAMV